MKYIVFILGLVCVVAVTKGNPDNYRSPATRRNTGEFGGTYSYYGRDKKAGSDYEYNPGYRHDGMNIGKKEPEDTRDYKESGYDGKGYSDGKYGGREYGREGRTYKVGEEQPGHTVGDSW